LKKYLPKIFAFVPLVLIIASISYFIDPENKFNGEKYAKGVADILLDGKNAANTYNYDLRLLEKYYIGGLKTNPDRVILGASKEMLINGSFFKDSSRVINSCVNSATIEDVMAIYDMYIQKGLHPKKLVIGIDPYNFNEGSYKPLYGSVREYYFDMCSRLHINVNHGSEIKFRYGKYTDLFSPGYVQKSLLFLLSTGNSHSYYATDSTLNNSETKLVDGSITYGLTYRKNAQVDIDENARNYLPEFITHFKSPKDKLSQNLENQFEKFIDFAKGQGEDISILYLPYHPIVYSKMKMEPKFNTAFLCEKYLRTLSHSKHIHFYGSLDPSVFGLSSADFYDGLHLKKAGLMKVLEQER